MIHIFDGAMGTMLQAGGLAPGACPELMNLDKPAVVKDIHRAYIAAGATIIETNTFGASPLKLAHYNLTERTREINLAAVGIAKEAAAGKAKVAGSVGPSGRFIAPLGDLSFEEAYDSFYTQAAALTEAGADYIIIETCIDLQEMRAALLATKAAGNVPVICQMSYSEDGRTVTGTSPAVAATVLEAMGAAVVGVNCSLGPQQLIPVVAELAAHCRLPISVQPNAGMPYLENGVTKFPMNPADFGAFAPKLVAAGATFLGGCCGTTPEHIKALAQNAQNLTAAERPPKPSPVVLTSRSKVVTIGCNLPTRLIGERINPTGRKKLAAEIREGSLLTVKKDALNQTKAGAAILDVNMGVGGINQTEAMRRAVTEISRITDTPLAIDTGDAQALEAGLRAYPGRALINSVSAEPERLKEFLPLAKKYGAALIVLPITAEGVPKTSAERIEVAAKIIDEAGQYGLTEGDFVLDALVMTVSADAAACREVLATLKGYRERFGYPTTMGLSNISFGLPARPLINGTFFAMCLAAGLNAPIMNPYDETMQNTLMAAAALLGDDPNGLNFSKRHAGTATKTATAPDADENMPVLTAIKNAVIDGTKDEIASLVAKALAEGYDTAAITNDALTAAMNDIGEDFGAGRLFLPQVLLSAETMRAAFDELQRLVPAVATEKLGTFVIATVKGDVHDLGKNITGALLANSGFELIDLGKDVDKAEIVKAAMERDADIVGLCALMTTTMTQIDDTIAALREAGLKARVMVGGAALTQEYADRVGADAYARDAVAAVKLAKAMLEK